MTFAEPDNDVINRVQYSKTNLLAVLINEYAYIRLFLVYSQVDP